MQSATTGRDDFLSSCTSRDIPGADRVVRFVPPEGGRWRLRILDTFNWDVTLALLESCLDPSSEILCNDDYIGRHSMFAADLQAGRPYFIVVDNHDGLGAMQISPFSLETERVSGEPPNLFQADAFWLPGPNALGIRVSGVDPDLDADGIIFQVLNSASEPIRLYGQLEVDFIASAFAGQAWLTWTNNPDGSFSGEFAPLLDPSIEDVAQVRVFARDSVWNRSVPRLAPVSPPVALELGAECSNGNPFEGCATEEVACLNNSCRVAHAPSLNATMAFISEEEHMLGLLISGQDVDQDLANLRLSFLDELGQPIPSGRERQGVQLLEMEGLVYQPNGNFEHRQHIPLFNITPSLINQVQVRLVDSAFKESQEQRAGIVPAFILNLGEPCDPLAIFDTCPQGTACLGEEPSCIPAEAPVIVQAEVFRNENDLFGVHITGTDVDGDPSRVRVMPLRPGELDQPLSGSGTVQFDLLQVEEDNSFEGWATFPSFFEVCDEAAELAINLCMEGGNSFQICHAAEQRERESCYSDRGGELVSFRIFVLDDGQLISLPVLSPILDTPLLRPGDLCDSASVFGICPEGEICNPQADPTSPWRCTAL